MKKILGAILVALLAVMPALADAEVEANYNKAVKKFKDSKRSGPFFGKSYGYAIFPTVGKGGFGIGGSYGKGRVYVGGKHVANTSLSQLTIGFQAGGQAYSQIMFFKNANAFSTFKTGKFELGAQATAVAITAGAGANVDYDNGIAIFTVAKGGLMYEASVGGQTFSYEAK
jgi:lipid-binding SYLF domain-containing protein